MKCKLISNCNIIFEVRKNLERSNVPEARILGKKVRFGEEYKSWKGFKSEDELGRA